MNKTDKNIHKVLAENELKYAVDSKLENRIMNGIENQKDHTLIISRMKRKAKMGLLLSLTLFVIYIVIIYLKLFIPNSINLSGLKEFYPSVLSLIVVVLLYIEMTFGRSLLKDK